MNDLIVCGGGLAGLALAAEAAGRGLSCTLVEKASELGGRARTQKLGQGLFNLGPHALYQGGAAERLLTRLGLPLAGAKPKASGYGRLNGQLGQLPVGAITLLTSPLLRAMEKPKFAALLATVGGLSPEKFRGMSASAWLDAQQVVPGVRAITEMFLRVTSYTQCLNELDAAIAVRQLQRGNDPGVRYLHGGWQVTVDQTARLATERGVRLRNHGRVAHVQGEAGGFTVTLADGESLKARQVALAMAPHQAAPLLEGEARATMDRWAAQAFPIRAACLDVALESQPVPGSNLVFGVDEPFYAVVHSNTAKLGEGAVLHLAKYLAHDEPGAPAEAFLEARLDQWQPGWRDRLVERRFLPEMTVINDLPRAKNHGRRAAQPDVVPGLFLASDAVDGPDGLLLDAALGSVEQVLGKLATPIRTRAPTKRTTVEAR